MGKKAFHHSTERARAHTHTVEPIEKVMGEGKPQQLPHPVSPTISVTRFAFTFSTILSRSASTASGGRGGGGGASSCCWFPSSTNTTPGARAAGYG